MSNRYVVMEYEEDRYHSGYVVYDTTKPWGEDAFIATLLGQTENNLNKARELRNKLNTDNTPSQIPNIP